MQLLVLAASAAVITALGLSATSSVPAPVPRATPTALERVAKPTVITSAKAAADGATGASTSTDAMTQAPFRVAFAWPLSPRPAVLRPFVQPRDQWSPGHRGVDLLAAVGQPVFSAADGMVAFSGVVAGRGVLTVQHSDGVRTTYEPVDERLASGTLVHRGTPVGVLSDEPGHCLPLHCLHWGAISGEAYRDPLSLLGLGRPVLLPLG
jgi:murein DD-endopeptidase MepM/ murein hydrolase activator NlpD